MTTITHIADQHAPAADLPFERVAEPVPTADLATRRKGLFVSLGVGIAIVALAYAAYDVLLASRHVETDNAYVGADMAQITPLVGAPVREVLVQDSQMVRKGDVLVRLDDTDARIALAKAEADLAQTIRRVRGLSATDAGLDAQIAARTAEQARAAAGLVSAQADYDKAVIDLKRREALAASGSVSGEELTLARNAQATAAANLHSAQASVTLAAANRAAAIGTRDATQVMIADTSTDTNPEVMAARATRDQARVDLDRMVLRAPFDGVVSHRQVQVGQRVQAGQSLMVVVPDKALYVDANYKEGQLAKVHPGQVATLTSDLYGSSVIFHGRVMGLTGGTGAAFAVVPAQNATGNWIKVVQRLPVRIRLDPEELAEHPLRVGLSMDADIDIAQ
jgi:membrane fusion protein (multidrug efflux system)